MEQALFGAVVALATTIGVLAVQRSRQRVPVRIRARDRRFTGRR